MQSQAKTVTEYINSLPSDRKKAIAAIRKEILKNIPKGFEEVMSYGMIGYVVPHKLYAKGYHANPELPLPFINLASQKNYISLYHMALYKGKLLDWFEEEWRGWSSKKLDMGKCCIRFRLLEDVPLELIGALSSKLTPTEWIQLYEKNKTDRI